MRAQSLFCPQVIPNLRNGACTNGTNGAFSGAAVASQALSELSETTTQETTRNTIDAVTKRRVQEEQRFPAGLPWRLAWASNLSHRRSAHGRLTGVVINMSPTPCRFSAILKLRS
jgi:hypothetical protein